MPTVKISALANLTEPDDSDLLVVVDVSDTTMATSGTTKRTTLDAIRSAMPATDSPRTLRLEEGAHVDHGKFWPDGDDFTGNLGTFMWDAWIVYLGGEYLISDGYGGGHALLWGMTGGKHTGNVMGPSGPVSFGGHYVLDNQEWAHVAVGWDGNRIGVWVNGILDGIAPFAGARRAIAYGSGGGGSLFVGGSDHSNGSYELAYLRGFERGNLPFGDFKVPFIPERFPSRYTPANSPCDFYCNYGDGNGMDFIDSSPRGMLTSDSTIFHHGRGKNGVLSESYALSIVTDTIPQRVASTRCPYGRKIGDSPAPIETARTPATPPGGCLVYDSFGRANQTFAHQPGPSLGNTEAGSRGPLAWQTNRLAGSGNWTVRKFGILGGQAVCTSDSPAVAWVPLATANHDVRAKRSLMARHCGETGVAFRVVDGSNFWAAYYDGVNFWSSHGATRTHGSVYWGKMVSGVMTNVGAVNGVPEDGWETLRVTAVGNQITIYRGSGNTWTQVTQFNDSTHATGQGGGITNLSIYPNSINSLARWDEFVAYAAS